jgi:hypothetical protein
MSNIFSNRFVQGGITFFTYQNFTGEIESTDSEVITAEISNKNSVTTTAATSDGKIVDASQGYIIEENKTENAVNNASSTDTINTTAEETTNNQ